VKPRHVAAGRRVRLFRFDHVGLAQQRRLDAAPIVGPERQSASAAHPRRRPADLIFYYSPISHVGIDLRGSPLMV
jgi:hypothetical protein